MDLPSLAARGAGAIHRAFDEHHRAFRAITGRVRRRFEERDWEGIRRDTVEKLELPSRSLDETIAILRGQLGDHLCDRGIWGAMKAAYTREILGRDDFEIAQTYFNSLTRKVFPRDGVDPALDYTAGELPVPFQGWEMASARVYAVRRVDAGVIRRVLEDAGFQAPFRDLAGDAALAAERLEQGLAEAFGGAEIDALDVLRPVFFRNKGAYLVGRVRRGEARLPVVLALVNHREGIEVDAVLHTEDETSVVFSFARWYFHVDVASPREVIGFLRSILPRKRVSELYISLGYKKHGKTELYRDLTAHIAHTDDRFVAAPGAAGLVMAVFTLPSYEFVFKIIKDAFPPQKNTTRERVMEKYRTVQLHDRVGRLVGFQEFEHLTFPRCRFAPELLAELLADSSRTVSVAGDDVAIRHCYVERRVVPLDLYLERMDEERAEAAAVDWGRCLKELAAANIFPGDVLLKNFGVTRHGRVLSYDYDELCPLVALTFREAPPARNEEEEMAAEPWYSVGEDDIFPAELRTFLGLQGGARGLPARARRPLRRRALARPPGAAPPGGGALLLPLRSGEAIAPGILYYRIVDPRPFLTAKWKYLAMLNYEVPPEALAPLVPAGTELDSWQGKTFVSVVGFLFLDTRVRGIAIPGHRDFEEVNLRFYVRRKAEDGWRRGVVFVKEIVPRFAIATTARLLYGEKYISLPMRHSVIGNPTTGGDPSRGGMYVMYGWRFRRRWNGIGAVVEGAAKEAEPGSEGEFITEHYWGYSSLRGGGCVEYRVDHPRWRVWPLLRPVLDCDVAGLYGPRFAGPLAGEPSSAFLADGSEVAVFPGRRVG